MTLSEALLITSALAFAALFAIVGVQLFDRYRPFLPPQVDREPKEPPRLHVRLLRHLVGGRTPAPGVPHEGATEDYADRLRDLRDAAAIEDRPLDPIEAETWVALNEYEQRATRLYLDAAGRIDRALSDFARAHDGLPAVELPEHVPAAETIEIALMHLRYGVREPAHAPRGVETDTAEIDVKALRKALDDEDRLYAWAAGDYETAVAV
jgi:hypothetical protein